LGKTWNGSLHSFANGLAPALAIKRFNSESTKARTATCPMHLRWEQCNILRGVRLDFVQQFERSKVFQLFCGGGLGFFWRPTRIRGTQRGGAAFAHALAHVVLTMGGQWLRSETLFDLGDGRAS
jgi:hypothetical protein